MNNQNSKAAIIIQTRDLREISPAIRRRIIRFQHCRRLDFGEYLVKEIGRIRNERNAAAAQ